VGVVGISYGGTLALQLAKLGHQGALTFKLAAVQAYSAPVSFAASIRQLDSYFSFDYTKVDLYKTFYNIPREFPVKKSLDQRMMQCALSRAFREDLKEAIEFMDSSFDADLKGMRAPRLGLPTGDGANLREERVSYAEAMNFGRYFQGLAVPYWSGRDAKFTAERLLAAGEMAELLPQTGENVQVIVSANDPLNAAGAVEGMMSKNGSGKITVLPRGGHLGYFDAQWTKKNLLGIFSHTPAETAAAKPVTLSYPR
jgi:predicted alpha/beta-fold hydrolase